VGLRSSFGHDWQKVLENDLPIVAETYMCSKCGYLDSIKNSKTNKRKARALDKWADNSLGMTCDEIIASRVLEE
jgi:hypothetical protein